MKKVYKDKIKFFNQVYFEENGDYLLLKNLLDE